MQRAAIARALVARPRLLLADEPTGNLDQETGKEIIKILRTLNQQQNLTIVMVTHDQAIAAQADRIVRLAGGTDRELGVEMRCKAQVRPAAVRRIRTGCTEPSIPYPRS